MSREVTLFEESKSENFLDIIHEFLINVQVRFRRPFKAMREGRVESGQTAFFIISKTGFIGEQLLHGRPL